PGSHSLTAAYAGDANYSASTSAPLSQVVDQGPTSLALATSRTPSTYGSSVTFTATVTPAAATGSVSFDDNGVPIPGATVPLSSGVGAYTLSTLSGGSHTITATYSG